LPQESVPAQALPKVWSLLAELPPPQAVKRREIPRLAKIPMCLRMMGFRKERAATGSRRDAMAQLYLFIGSPLLQIVQRRTISAHWHPLYSTAPYTGHPGPSEIAGSCYQISAACCGGLRVP